MESKEDANMKVGFLGLLSLLFVAAKLFGFISWGWWLVLLPAIIGFSINILIIAMAVLNEILNGGGR